MTKEEMRRRRETARRRKIGRVKIARVTLAALVVVGGIVGAATCVSSLSGAENKTERSAPEPRISESVARYAVPSPTAEEMLANGILTDSIPLQWELQLAARDAGETFGVPYKLLLAVMFRESSYNPEAENGISYGVMQIHKMNFAWLESELAKYGVTCIRHKPEDNIKAGAYLLGRYLAKYRDYHLALMCYNCGESGARKLWSQGIYSTQYSRNVLQTMKALDAAQI